MSRTFYNKAVNKVRKTLENELTSPASYLSSEKSFEMEKEDELNKKIRHLEQDVKSKLRKAAKHDKNYLKTLKEYRQKVT